MSFAEGDTAVSIKSILAYSVTAIRSHMLYKEIEKLPESDALYYYFASLLSLGETLITDGVISVRTYYKAISEFVKLQREGDMTAQSNADIIKGILSVIFCFPKHMQGELKHLTTSTHISI